MWSGYSCGRTSCGSTHRINTGGNGSWETNDISTGTEYTGIEIWGLFDGNPIQAIACSTPSSGEYTLTIAFSNLPGNSAPLFAKSVQLVIFNLTSTDVVNLSFDTPNNGILRFIGSKPPTRLAAGSCAVLALTGWPNNNVLIGYSAEVPS